MNVVFKNENNVITTFAEEVIEYNDKFFKVGGCFFEKKYFSYAEVDNVPEEVIPEKYCYVNGEFVLNPDWVEPEEPEENKNEGEN